MTTLCQSCGKSKSPARAGSITAYFFEHNYCQCEKNKQRGLRLTRASAPQQDSQICLNCGKSSPKNKKVGSFTAFLFKELRCHCPQPKFAVDQKSLLGRTRTAERMGDKLEFNRAEAKPLNPGTVIGGTFKIESIIGVGGMGTVYLAQHRTLPQKFALKVLAPSLVSEHFWKRFQSEAKTLANLKHQNLVNVYDLGIHENSVIYYSMDYLQGQTLEDLLAKEGPQTLERTIDIFISVLEGLSYAHRNGIIHRDIKPANIFICSAANAARSGEVKILDFGIAKLVGRDDEAQQLTAAGEVFGSPFYMSPEQCMGTSVDARSDIYAVGCAIFETLSGFVPFEAESAVEIGLMHQEDQPPLLANLTDIALPDSIDQLIEKCMAKLPRDRYQSAKEMALDLERIKEGKKLSAPRTSARVVTSEPDGHRSTILLGALVAVLTLGLVAVAIWFTYLNPPLKKVNKNPKFEESKRELDRLQSVIPDEKILPTQDIHMPPEAYSKMVEENGKHLRIFSFPLNYSLGTLTYFPPGQSVSIPAKGICKIPQGLVVNLYCSQTVADHPQLLKFFKKDDLDGIGFSGVQAKNKLLLPYIEKLTSLNYIGLLDEGLERADIARLNKLPHLQSLHLTGGNDYEALATCQTLPQWRKLSLKGTPSITPLLRALAPHNHLRELNLAGTDLSSEDINQLVAIKSLVTLTCKDMAFSAPELSQLSKASITNLKFDAGFPLNADCMKELEKFKNLESLEISNNLTAAERSRLRKALPKLKRLTEGASNSLVEMLK